MKTDRTWVALMSETDNVDDELANEMDEFGYIGLGQVLITRLTMHLYHFRLGNMHGNYNLYICLYFLLFLLLESVLTISRLVIFSLNKPDLARPC